MKIQAHRKTFLIVLLVILILGLTACRSPQETETAVAAAPPEILDLSVLKERVLAARENYEAEGMVLEQVITSFPAFQLQGEILIMDTEELVLWGQAFGPSGMQTPGWQIEPGNLKVLHANEAH